MCWIWTIAQDLCHNLRTMRHVLYFGTSWFYLHLSSLVHWQGAINVITPVPVRQPWNIWVNTSLEYCNIKYITTTIPIPQNLCVYLRPILYVWLSIICRFMSYTEWIFYYHLLLCGALCFHDIDCFFDSILNSSNTLLMNWTSILI